VFCEKTTKTKETIVELYFKFLFLQVSCDVL